MSHSAAPDPNRRASSPFAASLACLHLLLAFYTFGGAVVEAFVYYPAWKIVGPAEFAAFHQDMGSRLLPAFVAPFFLSILVNGLLLRFRYPPFPPAWVRAAFALNLLILVVTIGWAIPIQGQLSQAKSLDAIDRLIALDRPWRMFPGILFTLINGGLLFRLVRRSG